MSDLEEFMEGYSSSFREIAVPFMSIGRMARSLSVEGIDPEDLMDLMREIRSAYFTRKEEETLSVKILPVDEGIKLLFSYSNPLDQSAHGNPSRIYLISHEQLEDVTHYISACEAASITAADRRGRETDIFCDHAFLYGREEDKAAVLFSRHLQMQELLSNYPLAWTRATLKGNPWADGIPRYASLQ